MHFLPIYNTDLEDVARLQPTDWPDILPNIKLYIESDFCWPIKVIVNNEIAGIGAAICFEQTAWLAHIIVNEKFRNKGIGSAIVAELKKYIDSKNIPTHLLIATALGEPVYVKAGFRKVCDYLFFKREKEWQNSEKTIFEVSDYNQNFKQQLFDLDLQVTGENRKQLIEPLLLTSKIIVDKSELLAYYLPALGEGTIIAKSNVAGLEMMGFKYSKADKAVLPDKNLAGIDFLLKNGFVQVSKGSRMIYGKDIDWQPENIFSRIAGNFG